MPTLGKTLLRGVEPDGGIVTQRAASGPSQQPLYVAISNDQLGSPPLSPLPAKSLSQEAAAALLSRKHFVVSVRISDLNCCSSFVPPPSKQKKNWL